MTKNNTTKIEYKITTSVEGLCPHCHQEFDSSKTEETEDEYPSDEYWNESHRLFTKVPRDGGDGKEWAEYNKYQKDHPILVNLHNLHETWRDRIKEMPIKHLITSETIYVINGECPTCGKEVEFRHQHSIMMYDPPRVEIGEEKQCRQMYRCPYCNNHIIAEDGEFKQYPDRSIVTEAVKGRRGRPPKKDLKTFACPVCRGRQKVPESLYSTKTSSDTEVQCRSCQGLGYVFQEGTV